MNVVHDGLKVLEAQIDALSVDMLLLLNRSCTGKTDEEIAAWGKSWHFSPARVESLWKGIFRTFGLVSSVATTEQKKESARETFRQYLEQKFPQFNNEKSRPWQRRKRTVVRGI